MIFLASGTWHMPGVGAWLLGSGAKAAEVDASGAAAPNGFAGIVERVKPAVVGVRAKLNEQSSSNEEQHEFPFPPGSPLDRFFRQFGIPIPEKPNPEFGFASGSGFFISGDGYIVTNNHVVASGKNIEVTTDDGQNYKARIIGTDPQTDLALIKITARIDFPYVRLAPAEPHIGDWVLPIGNPFGLGGTVTAGIVSARGRDIGEGPYNDFIQIDAPVNKGNSGGPTFNVKGEVIGVNTAIYSPSGGSVGVAFDIPAETVKLVVQQLKDKGRVTRGWIGVQMQPVTPTIAQALGLEKAKGALVAQLEPNGPAAKDGIKVGDVIVSVNGKEVADPRDLARTVAAIAPGTSTKFSLFQNGKEKVVAITTGELPRASEGKPEKQAAPSEKSALGLTLAPAAKAGAGEQGVVVTDISPDGVAADSGLQIGDVILSVDGREVYTPSDVGKMVNEARAHSKLAILMRIKRGDTMSFVAVPIG
jgi:serine protease Do